MGFHCRSTFQDNNAGDRIVVVCKVGSLSTYMHMYSSNEAIKHYPSCCCFPLATRIVVWVLSGCYLVQLGRDNGVVMQFPVPE